MTARNDLDLTTLITETDETLTKLAELFQQYYSNARQDGNVDQFVKLVFGNCTWLISSLKTACRTEPLKVAGIPEMKIPPGAEVFLEMNNLQTKHALLTSISTKRIPELTTLINDFLKTPNNTETEIYKSLASSCNESLALLKKLDPIVKNLLESSNAAVAKFNETTKLNITGQKNQ